MDQRLLDNSLYCFTSEWREVLITCPEGTNLCVSLRHAPNPSTNCRLVSLERENQVWVDHLKAISDLKAVPEVLHMNLHFVGRKLHADVLCRKRDGPEDIVERLQLPLFADKPSVRSTYTLPLDEGLNWAVGLKRNNNGGASTEAWSVDMQKASLRLQRRTGAPHTRYQSHCKSRIWGRKKEYGTSFPIKA
jgi:hypothetical protein